MNIHLCCRLLRIRFKNGKYSLKLTRMETNEHKTMENTSEIKESLPNGNNVEDYELTRQNIEKLENVRLVDSDETSGLDLFCYIQCGNNDPELVKKSRGLVYHKDKLVLQSFPYTMEYNHTQVEELEDLLNDFSKFTFFNSYEGSLLRVFNFNGKWFLTTHRKLNAFRSKWATRESFGTLFKKALASELTNNSEFAKILPDGDNILDRFYQILDKDKQYMFLVLNNEGNRIVCRPPDTPKMFHVGTFINGELDQDDTFVVPKPQKHNWLNIDELLQYVTQLNYRKLQGVICFGPGNVQYKVYNKIYQDYLKARGNEPSVKFRYLQMRMKSKFTSMLYHLYPEYASVFDDYENTLYSIARTIYHSYVQRYIKKNYVSVPREEFQIIKECHAWHQEDRKNNRISLDKVIRILNEQSPTSLNRMIKRFKAEQSKRNLDDPKLPRTYKDHTSPAFVPAKTPVFSPLLLRKTENNTNPPKLSL